MVDAFHPVDALVSRQPAQVEPDEWKGAYDMDEVALSV
jgi:hypothetical protein